MDVYATMEYSRLLFPSSPLKIRELGNLTLIFFEVVNRIVIVTNLDQLRSITNLQ